MLDALKRGASLIGLLVLIAAGADAAPQQTAAGKVNTEAFLAACIGDPVVTDEPGLQEGSKVTAKQYCECVAGKFEGKKLGQTDVDMLTKMHKDEITDEDADRYPTLEDLMAANEGLEDDCKKSLGMPAATDDEQPGEDSGPPADEEDIPQDQ
jgi:hypothetical protein